MSETRAAYNTKASTIKTGKAYLHFPDGTRAEIKPVLVDTSQNQPIQTTLDGLIAALQRLRNEVGGKVNVEITYSIGGD